MTEIEQIIDEAVRALKQAKHLTAIEKAVIMRRVEKVASDADDFFMSEYEAALDREWEETCRRNGWPIDDAA